MNEKKRRRKRLKGREGEGGGQDMAIEKKEERGETGGRGRRRGEQ